MMSVLSLDSYKELTWTFLGQTHTNIFYNAGSLQPMKLSFKHADIR